MGWHIKAGITGKTGRKATIELPISDSRMAQILQKIRMGPLDTRVTITEIEPQELAAIPELTSRFYPMNFIIS